MSDPITWQPPSLPDVQGGSLPPAPETYTNAVLRDHGTAIAHETTRLFFAAWPELEQRYGERGRQYTYQDNYWHFATLDTALRHASPEMWTQYVDWLASFIRSRGMDDAITAANFVFFRDLIQALSLHADQEGDRQAVLSYLDLAIERFPEAMRTVPIQS
jgi:hypothetical protein